jgi:hypothetical protein
VVGMAIPGNGGGSSETADAARRHDTSEGVVDRLSRPDPLRAVGDTLGELTALGKAESQLGAGKYGGKTIEIILVRSALMGVPSRLCCPPLSAYGDTPASWFPSPLAGVVNSHARVTGRAVPSRKMRCVAPIFP